MAAALGALVLNACGGSAHDATAVPVAQPTAGPVRVSAQWLRQQPGPRLGEYSFHLLDSDGRALSDWSRVGLSVSAGGQVGHYVVEAAERPTDDIYLYVTYPGADVHVGDARLASGRGGEYVFLSVPGRIRDVLVIGMARIGGRRAAALKPGPLARISFAAGGEQVVRAASRVNEDPRSAAVFGASGGGDWLVADIWWEERNIGDYNNNGLVEVADITPIGVYFDQEVAAADDPALLEIVDGTLDGFVTIHDITPIGQNFDARIDGFRLYAAYTENPDPEDFELFPWEDYSTWPRPELYDATDELARRKRLQYRGNMIPIDDPAGIWTGGKLSLLVRAFADDGGTIEEGPPSNAVELNYSGLPVNHAPIWVEQPGLTAAIGTGEGILVRWGQALDPDGDEIEYVLRYIDGGQAIGLPGTVVLVMPPETTAGGPPYEYYVEGLTRGEEYTLLMKARDELGLESSNSATSLVRVPALGVSADTWPYHRFDPARTGCNAECLLEEPLCEAWTAPLDWPTATEAPNEPLISAEGWIGAPTGDGLFRRYLLESGADHSFEHFYTVDRFRGSLSGGYMAYGEPSSGLVVEQLYGPMWLWPEVGELTGGPLVLGDLVFAAGGSAVVGAEIYYGSEWLFEPGGDSPYTLSPAADEQHLYTVRDDGRVDKLDLLTGDNAATGDLAAIPSGDAVALDSASGRLYVATEDDWLVELSADDLSVLNRWPAGEDDHSMTSPCLVLHSDPPLAVVGHGLYGMIETPGFLHAINLLTGDTEWTRAIRFPFVPQQITAGQSRLFVVSRNGGLFVLDFAGNVRQEVDLQAPMHSSAVLAADRLALVSTDSLRVFEAAADEPPVWVGTEGVRELTTGDGSVTAHWDHAVDDNGEPVHYALYYRAGAAPVFSQPLGDTQLITGIEDNGFGHSYMIDGLDNGTRYYVAVRAYDGRWDDLPNVEQNTNVLAATPPWQREQLVLGGDLPAGEILFMRGVLDPTGEINLVYSDADDAQLMRVWGGAGSWQWEQVIDDTSWLVAAQAFDLGWNTTADALLIGMANTNFVGHSALLLRLPSGAYDLRSFDDTDPGLNPQVSLGYGAEAALAYTENAGSGVERPVDYYLKRTIAGVWQPVEPLDQTNLSGRDLDLVLSPADDASPWVALQRGGESTPNRYTPQEGECVYARWDSGGSTWSFDLVDAGDNAPDSDCGKRVVQMVDDDDRPRLAYLDLNADPADPSGQLKYAWYDAGDWYIEIVDSFPLQFNYASDQFIWPELGLALYEPGGGQQALIAQLQVTTARTLSMPQRAVLEVWVRQGADDWRREQLADEEWIFTEDRAPCVLLVTPNGSWHVLYATTHDQQVVDGADALVHYWRPAA